MQLILNVVFWIFIVICCGVIFYVILPTIFNIIHSKKTNNKDLSQIIRSFLASEADNPVGHLYTKLISMGFFTSLRTNNHSKDFEDKKQLDGFRRYANPDIAAALREIGESYEQYYV